MSEEQKKKQKQAKSDGAKAEGLARQAAKKERQAKAAAEAQADAGGEEESKVVVPTPRLLVHYREKVVSELKQKFGFTNTLAVPRLEKIVISMGVGKFATANEKAKIEQAEKELGVIAGQKPVRCKSKKSVANFKVREGQETGLKVTLRGGRMYEFLDRLITLAIPRVRDFRGLSAKGFDNEGNYNFGFVEQTVFPEVNSAEVTFQQGMNITMVTSASSAEHGRELLRQFGFPFRTEEKAG